MIASIPQSAVIGILTCLIVVVFVFLNTFAICLHSMDLQFGNSTIPPGYEPTDADMSNPVVQSLCNMLTHTEHKLHLIERAKTEYERVTESQTSRLRLKLADTKLHLQEAKDSIRELETRNSGALCKAVIERQKHQRLVAMQCEFTCGICLNLLNAPDVFVQCGHSYCHTCILELLKASISPPIDLSIRSRKCPFCRCLVSEVPIANYALEGAIEALIKAQIFERAPAVDRLPDDYKKYFPKIRFDRTPRASVAGAHRQLRELPHHRCNAHSYHSSRVTFSRHSHRTLAGEEEWDTSAWSSNAYHANQAGEQEWDTGAWSSNAYSGFCS
ncbi:hypothetical protein B0H16DRAFT_1767105 [Mycena metata]|uniref:RING-type domain-containing protein n=1 Tax=Mycena metata TaxID=1033252 RepID=A0AAD7I4Z0_9AGAR|nr:hypothetical protein B0H16DRAFT_1767105 [Mycena metata]